MAVDDIGNPIELQTKGERAAAEENKAQVVVRMISPRTGINFGSIEKLTMFEQVNRHG